MPLFKIEQKSLNQIKEKVFDLEKEIQTLTEKNLEEILGLKFVCSEFQLNNLRIDTLAFNPESNAFVIIEYKKDRNLSVIDQGYAYLALLLNNKADFLLEYNEKMEKPLKREQVDWSQSHVIFISPQFSTYQKGAIEFKDLPIELWEVKKYENEMVLFNQLKASQTSESIKTVSRDKTIAEVSKVIKEWTIEDHFKPGWEKSKVIFDELVNGVKEISQGIILNPQKYYISLKENKNFAYILSRKDKVNVVIMLDYLEGKKLIKNNKLISLSESVQNFYSGPCFSVDIENTKNLNEVLTAIALAYNKTK